MELRCCYKGTHNGQINTHSVCEEYNGKCHKGKQRQRLRRKSAALTLFKGMHDPVWAQKAELR